MGNSRFKFRAWDRFEGMRMLFGIDKYSIYIEQEKEIYGMGVDTSRLSRTDDVKIMQYTGLKEKNGVDSKEIYDGDILLLPDGIRKGIVVFINGCYFLKMKDGHLMNLYDVISISRVIRIIGNIYETPELLS